MTRWAFDSGLPQDELVTIRTFDQHSEYLVARALLESAGIECFSRDEHSSRLTAGTHRNIGTHGNALQVRQSDAADAIALLDAPPFEDGFIVEDS
jgi:hypothetical protein